MGERAIETLRTIWSSEIVVESIRLVKAVKVEGHLALAGETLQGTQFDTSRARLCFPDLYNQFELEKHGPQRPESLPSLREGDLIYGKRATASEGRPYFTHWWVADSAFSKVLAMIRGGIHLTEEEMGLTLHTPRHHDLYWALLRLVFFDNVQAFVDCAQFSPTGKIPYPDYHSTWSNTEKIEELTHPGFGYPYSADEHIDWFGMWLPTDVSHLIHEWSWALHTPEWWEEYVQKMGRRMMRYRTHPARNVVCLACQSKL